MQGESSASCHKSPVRYPDDIWHALFVYYFYRAFLEERRPGVTPLRVNPLSQVFRPDSMHVGAAEIGWVCRISSVGLRSQKATMKFDLADGSLFQI